MHMDDESFDEYTKMIFRIRSCAISIANNLLTIVFYQGYVLFP